MVDDAVPSVAGRVVLLPDYDDRLESGGWGPGVYGAEAAARYHYGVPANRIGREQGARLAAILPAPRRRQPARMNHYTARILNRMGQMGW